MNLEHRFVDAKVMTAAHRMGLSVWAWTVDDPSTARRLIVAGVDSITTN